MTYVVDHQGNGLHINSAGENIRGDENLSLSVTECVDNHVTLEPLKFTSQASNLVTLPLEASLDLNSADTSLTNN